MCGLPSGLLTEFLCLYFFPDSGDLYLIWCMTIALIVHFAMWWLFSFSDQTSSFICFPVCTHTTHTWLGGILLNHMSLIYMMKSFDECQNIAAGLLSVSMKPGSKDRMFLMWIYIAFMHDHNNLFSILQVSVLTCLIVTGTIARARRIIPLHTTRPHR